MEVMGSAQGTKDQERGDNELMKELKGIEVGSWMKQGIGRKRNIYD